MERWAANFDEAIAAAKAEIRAPMTIGLSWRRNSGRDCVDVFEISPPCHAPFCNVD